jgi:4-hydroxybenzoyl-CoA thioesterase
MAAPFVHETRRLIEWSACDPAGIVYYPRYAEMFDANTNALFEAATGLGKRALQARYYVVGWPMVDTSTSFRTPATYGDEVVVASHVSRFGGSSIELRHCMAHLDGRVIAEGVDKRVWTGRAPDRPGGIGARPLPQDFIAAFTL